MMRPIPPEQISGFQQNRYPFLFVDRVVDHVPGSYAKGYKNFTNNEWFFPVHFEGSPNVPGVIQIEAMAQMLTIAITTLDGLSGETTRALAYKADFLREVVPGDRMDIEANVSSYRRGICAGTIRCSVGGFTVSTGLLTLSVPKELKKFTPRGEKL